MLNKVVLDNAMLYLIFISGYFPHFRFSDFGGKSPDREGG